MTDDEIIEGIKRKDRKAFQRLVERYQQNVFRASMGILHNKMDAEDIAQDVFVEVYQSIQGFRKESKISTWLYRITINKSLNFIKRKNRKSIFSNLEQLFSRGQGSDSLVIDEINADTDLMEKEKKRVFHKALHSIPDNQKTAFMLHKYEDLSYKEIAEIMNVSLSAVESLIHRAKNNLRNKLVHYYKS